MCGIAGIFHYAEPERPVDRELLTRMTRALAHRGPDAEGFHYETGFGIGHRRLAIVDLSPAGAQPMANRSGNCWLAYNGEFYNHRAYRDRLATQGYAFRGSCDTETLLCLLEQDGPDALANVAGIFALAFWDARQRILTLARDQLGVKQLYYHDDGRRIVFGSEIKALLVCPDVPRDVDPEAVNQYLHFHTALFERTFFKDIRQLRAGEYLRISRWSSVPTRYWCIGPSEKASTPPTRRVGELREALAAVVGEQLMGDVPVGSFFSAGIDSSAVAAFAARQGQPPECFGVHFSGQGVPDERPYQEAAARRLGLSLNLITSDGSTFPDDLFSLMYQQDQPVIGAAMFPMAYVSRLAAGKVKVCLGGQGADEAFGGYARYALTSPFKVLRSWGAGRRSALRATSAIGASPVGGNLGRQLRDPSNLRRLRGSVAGWRNWERRYFEHMAKISDHVWTDLFAAPEFVDRQQCWDLFQDTVHRIPATDPAEKVMRWDVMTYLTGLFQQDDRMSMAVSLESRVPFADPRLIRFAFQTGFDLKFRGGATKWILRQAVSDVLPQNVLTRRKVGFDTPVELWMSGRHSDFVRDTLLSRRSRQRGIFNPKTVRAWLDDPGRPHWVDVIWKTLAIEVWATVFLDDVRQLNETESGVVHVYRRASDDPMRHPPAGTDPAQRSLVHTAQELRELGWHKSVARASWELKTRSGALEMTHAIRHVLPGRLPSARAGAESLQSAIPSIFADAEQVVDTVSDRIPSGRLEALAKRASDAARGRVLSFGRWVADYGSPIDWYRNPHSGRRWRRDRHWSRSLQGQQLAGDVKLIWEVARFPQAYLMSRASAFSREAAADFYHAFANQIQGLVDSSPPEEGIHWNSGQELAIRCLSWVFGLNVFSSLGLASGEMNQCTLTYIRQAGRHLHAHLEYASKSVTNNHLISEALGLYLAGSTAEDDEAIRWRESGRRILSEQAERQFYPDGAYLQQSHTYHRSVLQLYLCALALANRAHSRPEKSWLQALQRSLDFLLAHQNRSDGRLPNYGANDGAMPCVLSTCEFGDFRPLLQCVSVATRGERIYEAGPWDEETAWLCGPDALSLPLRPPARQSVSFAHTGYHVLRGRDERSFVAFRCGSIRDRFSQIDMLHTDVWWRGHNVLADAGSYLYNGPERWHDHFSETGAHNTITVDGRDQMLHYRRFKNLYWTRARLLRFEEHENWAICEGEHYGYRRQPGACVHRRCILYARDDAWVVVDSVTGVGAHRLRLQWLAGEFPYEVSSSPRHLVLETPDGPFTVAVLDGAARPLEIDVVAGSTQPPRGWLSRHYGEKVPVASLAVDEMRALPMTFVSILSAGVRPTVITEGDRWRVTTGTSDLRFRLRNGAVDQLAVHARTGTPLRTY